MTVCDHCGKQVEGDALPLNWSSATEGGRRRHFCGECTRANLRAMEGRLDSPWW